MDVAKDIVRISVPFVAGVFAAACFNPSSHTAAALSMVFAVCCLVPCCRERAGVVPFVILFFSLGVFCFCSVSLAGPPRTGNSGMMDGIREAIDGLGFSDGRTAPLLKALLTGDKSCLDKGTTGAFRDSGASHILALSGLHLGLIYLIVGKILAICGNSRPAAIFRGVSAVSVCGLYTLSTGAPASVTRAFLFIVLNELQKLDPSRKRIPVNIWCSAILIQLCIDPTQITSLGFQLSYLAMLGIFLLFPLIDSIYCVHNDKDVFKKIWSAMALSVSCQTFTAPLVWLHFHTFPKYFILTNLIALPLAECLIVSGIAALACSAIGWHPALITAAADRIASMLCGSLAIISAM